MGNFCNFYGRRKFRLKDKCRKLRDLTAELGGKLPLREPGQCTSYLQEYSYECRCKLRCEEIY